MKTYVFKVTKKTKGGGKRTTTESIEAENMDEAMAELDPPDDADVDVESVTPSDGHSDPDDSDADDNGDDRETESGEVEILSIEEVTESDSGNDDDSDASDSNGTEGDEETADSEDESESASDNVDDGSDDAAPEQQHWFYRRRGKKE